MKALLGGTGGTVAIPTSTSLPSPVPMSRPRARLRPDAQVLVDYPDQVKIVLPSGAALAFPVEGKAVETALALRTADKGWEVCPEVMRRLEERGLLVPHDTPVERLFLTGGLAEGLPVRDGRVCVLGDGVVAKAAWRTLIELGTKRARVVSGTALERIDAEHDIVLLALDRLETTTLESVNAWAVETGTPWLPAGPFEPRRLNVGPLVVPGETACWSCFTVRRRTNTRDRQVFDHLWRVNGARPRATNVPTTLVATAGHFAALEAARFLGGVVPATLEASWSLGLDGFGTAHDTVLRAPHCPVCSRLRRTPAREPWTAMPRGA